MISADVTGCFKEYLPASAPVNVKPAVMTVLEVPIFLFVKIPSAPDETRETMSPSITPARAAPAVFRVAEVELS